MEATMANESEFQLTKIVATGEYSLLVPIGTTEDEVIAFIQQALPFYGVNIHTRRQLGRVRKDIYIFEVFGSREVTS